MSDFHVFVGDRELPLDSTAMELNLERSMEWTEFRTPYPDATATFEITDAAWKDIAGWMVGDTRTVQLTNEYPLEWSRWRRWLNAVLRIAWWPLGPAALPMSTEVSVTIPEMRIERIAGGRGVPLSVEMSNRRLPMEDLQQVLRHAVGADDTEDGYSHTFTPRTTNDPSGSAE